MALRRSRRALHPDDHLTRRRYICPRVQCVLLSVGIQNSFGEFLFLASATLIAESDSTKRLGDITQTVTLCESEPFIQNVGECCTGRVLVGVQEAVEAQMSYYEGVVALENFTAHVFSKFNVPQKSRPPDYCIEKLVIS